MCFGIVSVHSILFQSDRFNVQVHWAWGFLGSCYEWESGNSTLCLIMNQELTSWTCHHTLHVEGPSMSFR